MEREATGAALGDARRLLDSLRADNQDVRGKLASAEGSVARLERELGERAARVASLEQGLQEAEVRLQAREEEVGRLAAEASDREGRIAELEKEVEVQEERISALEARVHEKKGEAREVRGELQAARAEVLRLPGCASDKQASIEQAVGEKAPVEAHLMKTRRGRMRLGAAARGPGDLPLPAQDAQEMELQAKGRYVERALARWTHLMAASAWSAWRFYTQTQKRATASARRIVGHWLHRSLAVAYETWHEHAHAQGRMRGILRRIAERWLHRDLAVAFTTWQEHMTREGLRAAGRRVRALEADVAWLRVSGAWFCWVASAQAWVQQQRRGQAKAVRAALFYVPRQERRRATAAFLCLRLHTQIKVLLRRRSARAESVLRRRRLAACCRAWRLLCLSSSRRLMHTDCVNVLFEDACSGWPQQGPASPPRPASRDALGPHHVQWDGWAGGDERDEDASRSRSSDGDDISVLRDLDSQRWQLAQQRSTALSQLSPCHKDDGSQGARLVPAGPLCHDAACTMRPRRSSIQGAVDQERDSDHSAVCVHGSSRPEAGTVRRERNGKANARAVPPEAAEALAKMWRAAYGMSKVFC